MSDKSSIDGSDWQNEGDNRSWDSAEDLGVLTSQLCRVCAEASEHMVQCFGERGKEIQLVDKIHTHLPIMVTEDDLLPTNVCTSCVSKLEICHELVINCLDADARLRTILGFDVMPTEEEQYGYTRPESPDSVESSEKTEHSQDDDMMKPDTQPSTEKEPKENEEKHHMDETHNAEQKSGSKCEVKGGYKVILLKMKKSNTVSPDTQMQKAMKFLKAGGKTYKVLNTTNQKSLIVKKLQKEELSGKGPQLQAVTTQSQETDIPAETQQSTRIEQKEVKGKTDEGISKQNAEWDTVKYECIYCDENITGRKDFVLHQSSVHKNEVFGCENCALVYELKEDFDEHVKCHQREKASLDTVDKTSSSNIATDQLSDCSKRKDTTELSTKSAKKMKFSENVNSNLERPVIVETENEGKKYWKCKVWQCKWCNHVATTKQGWKEHICEQVKQFRCPVCGDHFDSELLREEHQRAAHKEQSRKHLNDQQPKPTEEQKFQCAVCGKMYCSWVQLVQHSRVHLGQYKCPLCDHSFNRQSNLVAHIKRHRVEQGFTCRVCLEVFSNRGELILHRRNHSREELLGVKSLPVRQEEEEEEEVEEKEEETTDAATSSRYKCPICYRTLPSQQRLEVHVALHTDNSFPCHICGKVLSKKNTLEYHLRTHTGEKPFTCSMCPGAFQSRVGLIVHERIHTGEKPYQCDQCEMAFRCRATLNQHKVVHSDERPYRCMHCGRGFRRRDTLDTHIRTHTDERPYACRLCGRAFRQKGDCSKHEKTHGKRAKSLVLLTEGESSTVYNCPLCGQMYELKEDLDHHFENEHTPEEKASSIVIINSDNVITIPGIATVGEEIPSLVLHELS